jgi:hypothetical protein
VAQSQAAEKEEITLKEPEEEIPLKEPTHTSEELKAEGIKTFKVARSRPQTIQGQQKNYTFQTNHL